MVDLGDRAAGAVRELLLHRPQVHPLLLQRVALREVELEREDADEARWTCSDPLGPTGRIGTAATVDDRVHRLLRLAAAPDRPRLRAPRRLTCTGRREPQRPELRRLALGRHRPLSRRVPARLERALVRVRLPARLRRPRGAAQPRARAPARDRRQRRDERRPGPRLRLRAHRAGHPRGRRAEALRRLVDDRAAALRGRLVRRATTARSRRIARHRANLRVFDWVAMAHAHPSWFGSDGVHPTTTGYRARAAAIARLVRGCAA